MIKNKLRIIKLFLLELFLFEAIYGLPGNEEINFNGDDIMNDISFLDNENLEPKYITKVETKYATSQLTKYSTIFSTKTQTRTVTKTKPSYETYSYVTFLGTVGSKYVLGVNELKEYTTIKASYGGVLNKNESKYTRWLVNVKSITETPSKMYLADENGDQSDFCLDVGDAVGNSYYLTITNCSKANYLFKYYNVPYTDSNGTKWIKSPIIGVYKDTNTLFTNKNGAPYCVYYSETLYVKECKSTKDYPNYKWATVMNRGTHVHTITTTNIQTTTRIITTSTVKPSVTTSVEPTVITTEISSSTTDRVEPTNNIEN